MSSLLGRLKEFVGMPDAEGYEEYVDFEDIQGEDFADLYATEEFQDQPELEQPMTQPDITRGTQMNTVSTNNVVGMPGTNRFWGSATEVLVMEPNAFEEMPQVIQALREQKSVVLNLTMMDPAQAQRAVDFVAGATYTIDGHQERVGDSIFLFTPNCVQVSTQFGVVHEAPQPATNRSTAAAFQPQGQTMLNQIAQ